MRKLILSTLSTIALLTYSVSLSSRNSFDLSLDLDNVARRFSTRDFNCYFQIKSIADSTPGDGRDIQNAKYGDSPRFE